MGDLTAELAAAIARLSGGPRSVQVLAMGCSDDPDGRRFSATVRRADGQDITVVGRVEGNDLVGSAARAVLRWV